MLLFKNKIVPGIEMVFLKTLVKSIIVFAFGLFYEGFIVWHQMQDIFNIDMSDFRSLFNFENQIFQPTFGKFYVCDIGTTNNVINFD